MPPCQKWVGDITYVRTDEGWLYLATVVDLFSRKVVGWALGARMTKKLVIDAINQAIQHNNPLRGSYSILELASNLVNKREYERFYVSG